jgi:hypothetical protein
MSIMPLEECADERRDYYIAYHIGYLVAVASFGNMAPPNWTLDHELQKLEQLLIRAKRADVFVEIARGVYNELSRNLEATGKMGEATLAYVFSLNQRRIPGKESEQQTLDLMLELSLNMSNSITCEPQRFRCIGLTCYHAGIIAGEMFGRHDDAAVWHRRADVNQLRAGDTEGAAISSFCAVVSDVRHALERGDASDAKQRLREEYVRLRAALKDATNPKRIDWRDVSAPAWMEKLAA